MMILPSPLPGPLSEKPMTDLVSQPTGAPIRKVLVGFIWAFGLTFIMKSVPELIPEVLAHPAVTPLWDQLVTFAPIIAVAAGYQAKEWPTSNVPTA